MTVTARRGRLVTGLALVCALTVTGCEAEGPRFVTSVGSQTPPASRNFQPGAPGAGDDYFPGYGNGGYDVDHYTVAVRYDPRTDELTGTTTLRATADADLSRFNLDLAGLTVESVTVDGAAARHAQQGAELVVTPARGLPSGHTFATAIKYGGKPSQVRNETLGAGGFLHTDDGAIALGQPESASTWFPVNDHPSDKAAYEFEITVPEGLAALSNGVPAGSSTNDGWTTWKWAERTRMASYLTTVVIGEYRVKTGEHKGRPVVTAVHEDLARDGAAARSLAATTEVADYLETVFGPYPVDAYGGVAVADERIGYALETQSRPVYGPSFFSRGENTSVVVHEIAHQWFGNSVALVGWEDIWLNEGLATYAQWLWDDHTGEATTQETFDERYAELPAEVWRTPPGKPGKDNIFSASVYQRGACAVHALRVAVGDEAFFEILKTWPAEHRDANVTTDDFVTLAERVSGKQLDELFDAWLYRAEKPARPRPL